ncbi:MAG: endonuclease domain-containing protein [Acidobacteriota bacterium]
MEICRKLRKDQTDAEKKLWAVLRNRQLDGVKFRRQFSIGKYILDFYSPEYKLGIEADGGQHYEDESRQQDELRTKELSKIGVQILRFSNEAILNNIEGVYEVIQKTIKKKSNLPPRLDPLPNRERMIIFDKDPEKYVERKARRNPVPSGAGQGEQY